MDALVGERLRSGSGGDDMPPLLTTAARLAPPNIRALILEKEKELHDINEYRIRTLEELLRDKVERPGDLVFIVCSELEQAMLNRECVLAQ